MPETSKKIRRQEINIPGIRERKPSVISNNHSSRWHSKSKKTIHGSEREVYPNRSFPRFFYSLRECSRLPKKAKIDNPPFISKRHEDDNKGRHDILHEERNGLLRNIVTKQRTLCMQIQINSSKMVIEHKTSSPICTIIIKKSTVNLINQKELNNY
jgi:hypothetical protein